VKYHGSAPLNKDLKAEEGWSGWEGQAGGRAGFGWMELESVGREWAGVGQNGNRRGREHRFVWEERQWAREGFVVGRGVGKGRREPNEERKEWSGPGRAERNRSSGGGGLLTRLGGRGVGGGGRADVGAWRVGVRVG
jgi:hypothetical protein